VDPVNIQVSQKADFQQVAFNIDTELLIATVGLLLLTERMPGTLTFPASLATVTNAVVEFGPSCFTSYVFEFNPFTYNSKSNDSRLKGMLYG
jgi:hypothetical protein